MSESATCDTVPARAWTRIQAEIAGLEFREVEAAGVVFVDAGVFLH